MMLAKDAIGKNIRSLRIAFGETQDQLGLAIRTSKNNVSNYGKGRTTIPAKKLAAIADHYMLSYEELTQCDFSDLQKLIVDETSFAKHLHIFSDCCI